MALLGIIRRWHLRDKVPLREIAKRLGISRNTVRRYLRSETTEPAYAERQTASAIDPYAHQLAGWLKTEAAKSRKQRRSLKQLHEELVDLGFKGSYDRVAAFARQWREGQTEWVNSARKRTRAALTGILFVLKTGIRWNDLPLEMGCGSGVSCWRRLRDWQEAGVWSRLHALLLAKLRAADRIDFSRVIIDSSSIRAVGAGQKRDRTRRIARDQGPSTT